MVGDKIKREAPVEQRLTRGLRGRALRAVEMRHATIPALRPPVVDRIVEQNVVGRFGRLQERLDPGHVGVEGGEIGPERVGRIEFGRGVEMEAGPGLAGRREGRAMVDDVIDAPEEGEIHPLLHLRQRRRKMFAQPGAGFRRGQRLAAEVRRGGGEFHVQGIAALRFRNAAGSIEVQDVGR